MARTQPPGRAHGGGYWNPSPADAAPAGEIVVAVRGFEPLRLRTVRHAFSPRRLDPGSALLLEALAAHFARPDAAPPRRIVDLGAGYGPLGIVLARRFPKTHVDLIEQNAAAAEAAAQNARRLGLGNAQVHVGDVAAVWPTLAAHDLAVTNPPIRAGRAVYAAWFAAAPARLTPAGAFWFVARTGQGARTLAALLAGSLPDVQVAARGGGYRVVVGRRAGAGGAD